MPLSLIIVDGVTPGSSRPILAIRDPDIIAAVCDLLLKRLTDKPTRKILSLHPPKALGSRRSPRQAAGECSEVAHD